MMDLRKNMAHHRKATGKVNRLGNPKRVARIMLGWWRASFYESRA